MPSKSIHRTRNHRTAFTLLELLCALALLSVLAATVVPSFYRSYLSHRTMDQSIATVMESILLAKRLAIQKSTPHVYEFQQGSNVQSIYAIDNATAPRQTRPLPVDVRLESTPSNANGLIQIVFREDGSTNGFDMTVAYQNQSERIQVQRHLGIPQRIIVH